MGYWSVFRSCDYLDEHCDYEVSLPPEQALAALEQVLPEPHRVEVTRNEDGSLDAATVLHTPAWVFVPVILPLIIFVRKTRHARISVAPLGSGSVISARGKLDMRAASRVRELRAA